MGTADLQKIISYAEGVYSQNAGQHDIRHIERVRKNAITITDILNKNGKIDRNLLSAACYLHDILRCNSNGNHFTSLYRYVFEKSINRKHLGKIIKKFNLPENESSILTNAIINHPYSIPFRALNKNNDLYSQILQDADSIDYISAERLKNFNKKEWLLSPFSKIYIRLIGKNIGHFLNFPEIVQKMNLFTGD